MQCNKCGYIGDLSGLPNDPDSSKMNLEEAEQIVREEFGPSRQLFHKIGWTTPKPGYDLCPKCSITKEAHNAL